ncbi:MAG: hypothetical protein HYX78_12175 [Armatimonadetes bacterium]|nr:hypothetical protein [Armatimonadota bacterium]
MKSEIDSHMWSAARRRFKAHLMGPDFYLIAQEKAGAKPLPHSTRGAGRLIADG